MKNWFRRGDRKQSAADRHRAAAAALKKERRAARRRHERESPMSPYRSADDEFIIRYGDPFD